MTSLTYVRGVADDDPERPMDDQVDTVVALGYDAAGNVTSLTDAVDNQTTWTLDDQGRVTAETIVLVEAGTPREYTREFVYDQTGRLWIAIDRNGRAIEYLYYDEGDAAGRIECENWYAAGDDPRDVPAPSPATGIVLSPHDGI